MEENAHAPKVRYMYIKDPSSPDGYIVIQTPRTLSNEFSQQIEKFKERIKNLPDGSNRYTDYKFLYTINIT